MMNPELESRMRKWKWPFLFVWGLLFFTLMFFFGNPYTRDAVDEFLWVEPEPVKVQSSVTIDPKPMVVRMVVIGNNVRMWPIVGGVCKRTNALIQLHIGDTVRVIRVHEDMAEVTIDNPKTDHVHGCISGTMLGEYDGEG